MLKYLVILFWITLFYGVIRYNVTNPFQAAGTAVIQFCVEIIQMFGGVWYVLLTGEKPPWDIPEDTAVSLLGFILASLTLGGCILGFLFFVGYTIWLVS